MVMMIMTMTLTKTIFYLSGLRPVIAWSMERTKVLVTHETAFAWASAAEFTLTHFQALTPMKSPSIVRASAADPTGFGVGASLRGHPEFVLRVP